MGEVDMEYEDEMDGGVDYDGGETKGHPPAKSPLTNSKSLNASSLDLSSFSQFVKHHLQDLLPAMMRLERTTEQLIHVTRPYVRQGMKVYNDIVAKLEPYGIKEISTCLTGFLMMFFGGFFITTVAVYEAIVQGGLENFKLQMHLLYDEFVRFREANEQDDQEDLDNDGIADVLQISPEKYTIRKVLLAFRATDPDILAQSMHSLYTIFIAVAATLRLQFARTISLGGSLGDQILQIVEKFVIPIVKTQVIVDEAYHKWVDPAAMYISRAVGVIIAFQIQRILSTFHTAVKGARVFTRGLTNLAERNGYGHLTEGYLDEALSALLAVAGIYLQLFAWSQMPVVIKLLFFPAFFIESVLSMMVGFALSATGGTTGAGAEAANWW